MSASTVTPVKPLRPDEQPLAQYRSVSWSAVAAGILGLASAIVLVNPVLSPVAVAAAIVAILALRAIAGAEGQLTGRPIALAGLCLAMLFLGWGFTRYFTRQGALETQARKMADAWIALVKSGRLREAIQFRQSPAARIMSAEALAEHYTKNQEAAQELAQFAADPLIKELSSRKENVSVRFEEVEKNKQSGLIDQMTLKYTFDRPQSPGGRQNLWIHLKRGADESTLRPEWELEGFQILPLMGREE